MRRTSRPEPAPQSSAKAVRVPPKWLGDDEREPRAAFYAQAAQLTPYVAASIGDELFFVATADKGVERGLFVRRSRSDVTVLGRVFDRLDEYGLHLPADAVFIEVGGNIGTTTVMAIRRYGFTSAVVLEPSPASFRTLRINLVANEVEKSVLALPVAASDREGKVPFDTRTRNSGAHRIGNRRPGKTDHRNLFVEAVTLDGLIERGMIDPELVGLLWVDAPKHECNVLNGATTLIETGVPIVMAMRTGRVNAATKTTLVSLLIEHYTDVVGLGRDPVSHRIHDLGVLFDSRARPKDVLFVRR
jgi:FkbM family methyltransferase